MNQVTMLGYIAVIEALGLFALSGGRTIQRMFARMKKRVRVLVDNGNEYEETYCTIEDVLLVEKKRGVKRTWIIANPEDIKYDPKEKMLTAIVDSRVPVVLNPDIVKAAKLAWKNHLKLKEIVTDQGWVYVTTDEEGNEKVEYAPDITLMGTTVNANVVNKVIKSATPAYLDAFIDRVAMDKANRMNRGNLSSFMLGLIGALVGFAVAYTIMKSNTVDVNKIVAGVKAASTVATNATITG